MSAGEQAQPPIASDAAQPPMTYRETDRDDPAVNLESEILEVITKGRPYVLVTADLSNHPAIDLALAVGGGINDLAAAEVLLAKALNAARRAATIPTDQSTEGNDHA